MGPNLMSPRSRNRVIEVARRTVAEQISEPRNRELLAELPQGDPRAIRRPEGAPVGVARLAGPETRGAPRLELARLHGGAVGADLGPGGTRAPRCRSGRR